MNPTHAVSSSQPPTTSSSSLEISKRAAIKPRWKKLPEATQSYVASLASLTPLEESLLDADSVTRAQIFQDLIAQCTIGDLTGEYMSLAHIFTTLYAPDLPQDYLEALRAAMSASPLLQFSPLFQKMLEIFGLTSDLVSYVKAYDKEMNSDTDSPPAHRVMRKRRGRKKEKRPQTSRTSQEVIEDDAEEELEIPAALPSVQSLPVLTRPPRKISTIPIEEDSEEELEFPAALPSRQTVDPQSVQPPAQESAQPPVQPPDQTPTASDFPGAPSDALVDPPDAQVDPPAVQEEEELEVAALLVHLATEVAVVEDLQQDVVLPDIDSTTVWKPGGNTPSYSLLMLRDYEEELLDAMEKAPVATEGLQKPWSEQPDAIPLEELETPEAASFIPLDDLPVDQSAWDSKINEYFDTAERNVSQAMKDAVPAISKFFRSKQARRVFGATIQSWTGINGIGEVELVYKSDLPAQMRSRVRPINHRFLAVAEKELQRLLTYFLEMSKSPYSSPMVCAPKATSPYVRICGDYRLINLYIVIPNDVIPNVIHEIEKARSFPIYADLDLTNAFHQIPIGPITRERLAIITPMGLVQPKFLPEGVGPASGILQQVVSGIFRDYETWMVVIFDNLLVLATDYQDCFKKLQLVINRCDERNVKLKMSKSFIGVTKALFFGYEIEGGAYRLSQERRLSIDSVPMPVNLKQMQRFLGMALYFKNHISGYSALTASLTEMTHKDFSWNRSTWSRDYDADMRCLKDSILNSHTLHFPDYTKEWILRSDASDVACGGCLLQLVDPTGGNGSGQPVTGSPTKQPVQQKFQVIAFVSHKFSGASVHWDIPKKEAFAIYFSVKKLAYYLRGKFFVIETDHANLVWMEKSEVAIIIRWRMFLQNFAFLIRHILGKANDFADCLSRMFMLQLDLADGSGSLCIEPLEWNTFFLGAIDHLQVRPQVEECLQEAHVYNRKHCGVRETRRNLNTLFPGHHIHYRLVQDHCDACPVCQKVLRGMLQADTLEPLVLNLKPAHQRSACGVDTFDCSPPDRMGHVCVHVVVNHFTNFVFLYPAKDRSAKTMAAALFKFFITYGSVDEIVSDPGSNLTASLTEELFRLFGTRHRFSMVGVHTASGVEGTNALVLKHLRSICADKNFRDRWGEDAVIGAWSSVSSMTVGARRRVYGVLTTSLVPPMVPTCDCPSAWRKVPSRQNSSGCWTKICCA